MTDQALNKQNELKAEMATDEAIRQREVFPSFEGFHTLKRYIELARVEKLFDVSEFPGIFYLLW